MVKWQLVYTKQAQKDAKHLARSALKHKAEKLLEILSHHPFQQPPPFEKLRGDLEGVYSRRINIQHRLVYQVLEESRTIKLIRMWTYYENETPAVYVPSLYKTPEIICTFEA